MQSELDDLISQCNSRKSATEDSSGLNGQRIPSKPAKICNGGFEKTLSDESVREDFVAIVRDLEDRALDYANRQKSLRTTSVTFADGKLSIRSTAGLPFTSHL